MPKIVVPEERRAAISDAVIRVVRRAGVEGATLRTVADEAGLAIGSVRHYFGSHEDVLIFTMRELGLRIGRRIGTHVDRLLGTDPDIDRRAAVEDLFAEFLPLDPIRWDEAVVWLAFTTAARTRPSLRDTAVEQHAFMRGLITRVLQEATARGALPDRLDLEVECLRLSALLDGLTLQAVLHPENTTPDLLLAALRRSLTALQS
ncbi:TetR/AcrR family transcriptional regulator [Actinokineospora diospyrosa]|uniref:Transcriptional regulator, TetR family n=1 Tax=Actinokineospora diospyrosa TaxID=103728 RepID=A0ABT1INC2_9PSEU|nr:TetR family transcriptional regulator C-terminal domain-containing protein [Actinokineospora diospyrosa]MCP2274167.1 transcriptional regulator, TetR family [Actinokineospora diospyrosa]